MTYDEELKLRQENLELRAQLASFVSRKEVRRVHKMLGNILRKGAKEEVDEYYQVLKDFSNMIEVNGVCVADNKIKDAIRKLLVIIDTKMEFDENDEI